MDFNLSDIDIFGIPEIIVTKSVDGSTGTAHFVFKNKDLFKCLQNKNYKFHKVNLTYKNEILLSHSLKIFFENGHPTSLTFLFVLKNLKEWEIFNQFMKFYSAKNSLTFDNFKQ